MITQVAKVIAWNTI